MMNAAGINAFGVFIRLINLIDEIQCLSGADLVLGDDDSSGSWPNGCHRCLR
jgi:hypothetical protein